MYGKDTKYDNHIRSLIRYKRFISLNKSNKNYINNEKKPKKNNN